MLAHSLASNREGLSSDRRHSHTNARQCPKRLWVPVASARDLSSAQHQASKLQLTNQLEQYCVFMYLYSIELHCARFDENRISHQFASGAAC